MTDRSVIEKVFKRQISPESFYDLSIKDEKGAPVTYKEIQVIRHFRESGVNSSSGIVWTKNAVRLAVLILHSLR